MTFNPSHDKHYFFALFILITVILFIRPVSAKTQIFTELSLICNVKTEQTISGIVNRQLQSDKRLGQAEMGIRIERMINDNDEYLRIIFYGPKNLQATFLSPIDSTGPNNERKFSTGTARNYSREGLISFFNFNETPVPTFPSLITVDIDRHTGIIQGQITHTLSKAHHANDTTEFHGTCRLADPKKPLF